jgi:hypothetical protein
MQTDAQMLRLRMLAAAAMLFAGVTFGFMLGRMSAWILPIEARTEEPIGKENSPKAADRAPVATGAASARQRPGRAETEPEAHLPATTSPSGSAPVAEAARVLTPAEASPPGVGVQAPAVGVNLLAASADRASAADQDKVPGSNVKLINPSQRDTVAAVPEPSGNVDNSKPDDSLADHDTDRQGIATCERRYTSFRRSDGTYQPFGGGARLRCPFLR